MENRAPILALIAALALAGGYALLKPQPTPEPAPTPRPEPAPHGSSGPHGPHGPRDALPPGHPPVQGSGSPQGAGPAPGEPSTLAWQAPSGWVSAPNPSSMRLATYKIPHAGKDTEDAELSISRAGGSTDANIQRWVGQFDNAGKDTRSERTVRGMKVTVVEVSGTYLGGMGGGAKKPGWSLLGAIVESKDGSYFFKMTGPTDTVKGARGAFESMLDSLAPRLLEGPAGAAQVEHDHDDEDQQRHGAQRLAQRHGHHHRHRPRVEQRPAHQRQRQQGDAARQPQQRRHPGLRHGDPGAGGLLEEPEGAGAGGLLKGCA